MSPLVFPPDWPPPPMPSLQYDHWLVHVPILGKIVSQLIRRSKKWNHIERVLGPIEQNIIKQLESRPPFNEQYWRSREKKIMHALAKAVCKEKGIVPVRQLHPDDPGELILWGSFDDITPFEFRMNLEKSMNIHLSKETTEKTCEPGMTVSDIVKLILVQHPDQECRRQ